MHEKAQNFQCEKCDKIYALKLDLERHFTSNHILEKGLFKCEICDRHFNQDSTLYSHKQLVHDVSSKFNCAICGKVYHLTNYLKRHMKSHEMSNDKTVCDICGKVVLKNNINLHKRVHAKKDTKCTLCDIDFKHLKTLKRHLDHDHKNISFKCDICDKKLLSEYVLRNHMRSHGCSKEYANKQRHQCEICNAYYASLPKLQNHLKFVHENHLGSLCQICGKYFRGRHDHGVNFLCTCCGKSFSDKSNLKKHIKTVHRTTSSLDSKIYACDICEEKFSVYESIIKHYKTHGIKKIMDARSRL